MANGDFLIFIYDHSLDMLLDQNLLEKAKIYFMLYICTSEILSQHQGPDAALAAHQPNRPVEELPDRPKQPLLATRP